MGNEIREQAAKAAREKKMKNVKLCGTRVNSTILPLDGKLKYHVFDVDEVEPFCHNSACAKGGQGFDWTRSVPWSRVPDDLKCPTCLRLMLKEDGNRWGIK